MTNYCTSVSIVHNMASGMSPQDACLELLRHMVSTDRNNRDGDSCVIAINNRGQIGAASMRSASRFPYALWMDGESKLLDAVALH